ncbi:hypothetical protein X737_18535 [Mesorhizobium sp. L48C026A00]|nr:hypothetical protein X737_18535 [Mesorhizobium sp. L48C026A00]
MFQLQCAQFLALFPQAQGVADNLAVRGISPAFDSALQAGSLLRGEGYGKGAHGLGFHA